MAKNDITKSTTDPVIFPLNHRAWDSSFTIQNLTDQTITVEVTNQNIQRESSLTWSDPDGVALTIAANEVERLNGPYTAARFSGTGTGDIEVCELY